MILRRIGNKSKIAQDIIRHFPGHDLYIELFFGGGGLFFNKPLATHNICNDNDDDVFNLYTVLQTQREALIQAFADAPYHESLWKYWKTHKETEPVRKAVRFLYLSSYGYMGKPDTLLINLGNSKELALQKLSDVGKKLELVQFTHCDFREVLRKISLKEEKNKRRAFIYADPPYLQTSNNYKSGFTERDSIDLFDVLCGSGIRFAMSEFNNPFILEQAAQRGLCVTIIGERQTQKNRQVEILVTNYETQNLFTEAG